jgi:hypothetical protein
MTSLVIKGLSGAARSIQLSTLLSPGEPKSTSPSSLRQAIVSHGVGRTNRVMSIPDR